MAKPLHNWLDRYQRLETLCHTKGAHLRDYQQLCQEAREIIADLVRGGAECEGRCNPGLRLKQVSTFDYSVQHTTSNGTSGIEQEQYLPSEPFGHDAGGAA